MSETQTDENVIRVERVPISFPDVWKPSKKYGNYSVHGLFEKGDANYTKVMAKVLEVAKGKWPKEGANIVKTAAARDKLCVHNGELKEHMEGYAGKYYISATRRAADGRPTLFDRQRNEITDEAEAAKLFYSGAICNLLVEIWPYAGGEQAASVFCGLRGVQFVSHGKRFSGGGKLAKKDEFDDLGDPDEGDDLVGGGKGDDLVGDDDITF